jgi:hypothetical protein
MVGNQENHVLLLGRRGWKILDLDLRNWLRWKSHFENAVVADLKYWKVYKWKYNHIEFFIQLCKRNDFLFLALEQLRGPSYSKAPDMVPLLQILNV